MEAITQLWMPILVTAVLIFVASSVIHMVIQWHKGDYKPLANEDDVRAVIRAPSPGPGLYVIPYCSDMKEMGGEAMKQKFREGPVALLTIRNNGDMNMGKTLLMWFVYSLVVAAIAGCLTMGAFTAGRDFAHKAGHLAGMISFLTYFGGSVQMGIWMGKPWSSVARDLVDCLVYGVISALVFMWLWP